MDAVPKNIGASGKGLFRIKHHEQFFLRQMIQVLRNGIITFPDLVAISSSSAVWSSCGCARPTLTPPTCPRPHPFFLPRRASSRTHPAMIPCQPLAQKKRGHRTPNWWKYTCLHLVGSAWTPSFCNHFAKKYHHMSPKDWV